MNILTATSQGIVIVMNQRGVMVNERGEDMPVYEQAGWNIILPERAVHGVAGKVV